MNVKKLIQSAINAAATKNEVKHARSASGPSPLFFKK